MFVTRCKLIDVSSNSNTAIKPSRTINLRCKEVLMFVHIPGDEDGGCLRPRRAQRQPSSPPSAPCMPRRTAARWGQIDHCLLQRLPPGHSAVYRFTSPLQYSGSSTPQCIYVGQRRPSGNIPTRALMCMPIYSGF